MKRRELIGNINRCYRCLVVGYYSKECFNAKRCGVDGCLSVNYSSYFYENIFYLIDIIKSIICERFIFSIRRVVEFRIKNFVGYRSKY